MATCKNCIHSELCENMHNFGIVDLPYDAAGAPCDHFLDNNVLSIPCNVGDTAYMITTNGEIRYLTVTHIDIKLRENRTEIICIAEGVVDGLLCKLQIIPSKIGEIYFFNLEDAKKKLKERKE